MFLGPNWASPRFLLWLFAWAPLARRHDDKSPHPHANRWRQCGTTPAEKMLGLGRPHLVGSLGRDWNLDNESRSGRSPGYSRLQLGDHWFKYSPLLLPSKHTKSMVKQTGKIQEYDLLSWWISWLEIWGTFFRHVQALCFSWMLPVIFKQKSFISRFQHRKSRWKKHKSHEYVVVTYTDHRYIQYKYIPSGYLTYNHGTSPFLIGKPSISMGHLYHGYVATRASKCLNCIVLTSWSSWATPWRTFFPQVENQEPSRNQWSTRKKKQAKSMVSGYLYPLVNIAMVYMAHL